MSAAGPPQALDALLAEARACTVCAAHLPLGPKPVLRASACARLLIVGQAPGTKVHATGIPWNDPSGVRLRAWMNVPPDVFYDEARIAIVPMGLCYPGRNPRGGDRPPRPECAPLWQHRVRAGMPGIALTLLIGQYAQRFHLGGHCGENLTETVRNFTAYLPAYLPLPHPSFRNTAWLKRNPWFEEELLPVLRARVAALLA